MRGSNDDGMRERGIEADYGKKVGGGVREFKSVGW